MQDIQKSLVKGMIPIVQLAEQCCKSKELLDPVKTRSYLSSIDLILSALDFIVTEALTALAKPEEILPLVFSSVCNWGISQSKLPSN
jgi:hypothetical protein